MNISMRTAIMEKKYIIRTIYIYLKMYVCMHYIRNGILNTTKKTPKTRYYVMVIGIKLQNSRNVVHLCDLDFYMNL